MSIIYEWDVEEIVDGETVDYEDGEVLDHLHQDSYSDCVKIASCEPPKGSKYIIVLVRNKLDNHSGLVDRSWAYLKDGMLPDKFEDALGFEVAKVPQKYHSEVEKHHN